MPSSDGNVLPIFTPMRAERYTARASLYLLAVRAGIPATKLSLAEREKLVLTDEEDKRRRDALHRIVAERK